MSHFYSFLFLTQFCRVAAFHGAENDIDVSLNLWVNYKVFGPVNIFKGSVL